MLSFTGWLNAYVEGGWLPSWASPGYRNCMVGTFADVVVADAIVKNIKGFNLDQAVAAILKDVSLVLGSIHFIAIKNMTFHLLRLSKNPQNLSVVLSVRKDCENMTLRVTCH